MNLELKYLQVFKIESLVEKEIKSYEDWLNTSKDNEIRNYIVSQIKECNEILDKIKKSYDF